MARAKAIPATEQEIKEVPEVQVEEKAVPEVRKEIREMPAIGVPENTVKIGDELIEIKPMKLKYQRNHTGVFYHILEMYPLPDILAMDSKAFGDGRDGDKALLDWLVAATDNEELVRKYYNEMDTDTIYRILAIFKRVNKVDEREEKLKNAKTPMEKE